MCETVLGQKYYSLLASAESLKQWPWQEKSAIELNEDVTLTKDRLDSLRQKIRKYCEKHPTFWPQMDDAFLMAFLRTRKFRVEDAFKSFLGFYEIRLCNPECIFPVGKGPLDYRPVFELPLATLMKRRNPYDGTFVMLWIFKHYDHRKHRLEDAFNATFSAVMAYVCDPSLQVYGARLVLDIKGMSLGLVPVVLSRLYYIKALAKAHGCFPMRFKGFHVINEPFNVGRTLFNLVKPFLTSKMCERVHFHGSTLGDLHKYISPEILPSDYDGSAGPIDTTWMLDALSGIHDDLVKNSYHGFSKKIA